jgi:hypothetical protein
MAQADNIKKCNIKKRNHAAVFFFLFAAAVLLCSSALAVPGGPVITSNSTDSGPTVLATSRNDSGGTLTTLKLNFTQQNLRWKAYIGNVSGRYVLQDSANYSIYDWTFSSNSGEVYATRASSVTWSTIACADNAEILAEQTAINQAGTNSDTIAATFDANLHDAFAVGTVNINENSCNSTATNVNGASQTAVFQEVLLNDGTAFVYSTLLDYNTTGYNAQKYDFQMIVPEDYITAGNTQYYFFVELI